MEKLDKVIAGLRFCCEPNCICEDGCPYEGRRDGDRRCLDFLMEDALAVIESQRAELADRRRDIEVLTEEHRPVIHARWISEIVKKPDWKGQEREYYQPHSCSHCHTADPRRGESRFCSECGAIMDEKVFEPTPIGKLLFSMRVHKRLKSAGILTMEQLAETDKHTLHNIEGLGKQSILEIEEKLAEWQKERNKNG